MIAPPNKALAAPTGEFRTMGSSWADSTAASFGTTGSYPEGVRHPIALAPAVEPWEWERIDIPSFDLRS
jgi:hypothetical protein